MARVRFTDDFDYKPTSQTTVGYRKGMVLTVKRECADQAVAAGKAVEVGPIRSEPDGEDAIGR